MKRVDFIFGNDKKTILVKETPNGKFIVTQYICRKQ